uniref:Putative ovule protein n=1 Tax=Solanum chacoense TaxID=4108 RepID=A0A0V0HBK5_SOLCH
MANWNSNIQCNDFALCRHLKLWFSKGWVKVKAFSVCLNAKKLFLSNYSVLIDDITLSTLQIVIQRLDHCQYSMFCPLGLKWSLNNIFVNFFCILIVDMDSSFYEYAYEK